MEFSTVNVVIEGGMEYPFPPLIPIDQSFSRKAHQRNFQHHCFRNGKKSPSIQSMENPLQSPLGAEGLQE